MSERSFESSDIGEPLWNFGFEPELDEEVPIEEYEDQALEIEDFLLRLAEAAETVEEEEEELEDEQLGLTMAAANAGEIWLDGQEPLNAKRPIAEAVGYYSGFPKKDRDTLSKTEQLKLKKQAEEGLERKFVLMKPVNKSTGEIDVEKLKSIYPVRIRIGEFQESLRRYDMEDVFTNVPDEFGNNKKPVAGTGVKDLFSPTTKPTIESVRDYSIYVSDYGPKYMVQNLLWSGTKFLESCDKELRNKIKERTNSYSFYEKSGPVYFCVGLEMIQSSAEAVLRTLTRALETVHLKHIDGENVWTLASILRGITESLSSNNLLPADAMTLVANSLTQCSTQKFVSFVEFMYHEHTMGSRKLSIDEVLTRAERRYDELLKSNQWMASTASLSNPETGFKVEHKDVECYNCHKKGHIARNCPEPAKENAGRGGGRGRNGRGGRTGRGGRGRGGRGDEKKPVDPLRVPPKQGEPREKTINNQRLKWCGRCSLWNDHSTETHRAMAADNRGTTQGTAQQANIIQTTPSSGTSAPRSVTFGGLAQHF